MVSVKGDCRLYTIAILFTCVLVLSCPGVKGGCMCETWIIGTNSKILGEPKQTRKVHAEESWQEIHSNPRTRLLNPASSRTGMVEYMPCCTAPALHWGILPATRLASMKIHSSWKLYFLSLRFKTSTRIRRQDDKIMLVLIGTYNKHYNFLLSSFTFKQKIFSFLERKKIILVFNK
jgi:hypothetical protein